MKWKMRIIMIKMIKWRMKVIMIKVMKWIIIEKMKWKVKIMKIEENWMNEKNIKYIK